MPTIIPKDAADRGRLAGALLAAAGDQPERVKITTAGPGFAFEVDDDLAAAVGTGDYVPDEKPEPEKPAAAAAEPAPVKRRPGRPRKNPRPAE